MSAPRLDPGAVASRPDRILLVNERLQGRHSLPLEAPSAQAGRITKRTRETFVGFLHLIGSEVLRAQDLATRRISSRRRSVTGEASLTRSG